MCINLGCVFQSSQWIGLILVRCNKSVGGNHPSLCSLCYFLWRSQQCHSIGVFSQLHEWRNRQKTKKNSVVLGNHKFKDVFWQTLEGFLLLAAFPWCAFKVTLQVVGVLDGLVYAVAFNAGVAALLNARIAMQSVPVATTINFLQWRRSAAGSNSQGRERKVDALCYR